MWNLPGLFLFYSFIGWMMDTTFRSVATHRFTSKNFLHIPLTPIYGIGALLILYVHPFLAPLPLALEWLAFGGLLTALEYVGGVFCVRVLHRRLWKYTEPFSAGGHTNLYCIPLWGTLALAMAYAIQPFLERYV